jgi:hypothetical protein
MKFSNVSCFKRFHYIFKKIIIYNVIDLNLIKLYYNLFYKKTCQALSKVLLIRYFGINNFVYLCEYKFLLFFSFICK